MAKKIEEVPIPKDNFLGGYKPIVPNFATEEETSDDSKTEKPPVPDTPVKNRQKDPKDSNSVSYYEETFLCPAGPGRKVIKLGVSDKHYKLLDSLVERLGSDERPISKVSYLWNVLENHFATYGKKIKELIDKAPPRNEFDQFQ